MACSVKLLQLERIPILTGQTASGKTEIACRLVEEFDDLIVISADSRKIYRYMDIGTAKPHYPCRYRYRMLDIVEPDEQYNVWRYYRKAEEEIGRALSEGRRVLVEGGTVFYIRALMEGLSDYPPVPESLVRELESMDTSSLYRLLYERDPRRASRIHPSDRFRILRSLYVVLVAGRSFEEVSRERFVPPSFRYEPFVLSIPVGELYRSIEKRVYDMLEEGLLQEVRTLVERYGPDAVALRKTIDYFEFIPYLEGKISLERAIADTIRDTKDFARRQKTFLKKIEGRRGGRREVLHWLSDFLKRT